MLRTAKISPGDRALLEQFVARFDRSEMSDAMRQKYVDRLTEGLYPCQAKVLTSESTRRSICTPRQVGKTKTLSAGLGSRAVLSPPNVYALYVTDTKAHAKELLWEPLQTALSDAGIEFATNSTSLIVTIRGAGKIKFFGVDEMRRVKRLRGLQYSIVCIDEMQDIPDDVLWYLIDEVLDAGMAAYQAPLMASGTPGPAKRGLFFDSTLGKHGFEPHSWDQHSNPLYPLWAGQDNWHEFVDEWLDKKAESMGGKNEPKFLREYMGVWAEEKSIYIFHPVPDKALFVPTEDDAKKYGHLPSVLGIDLGFSDEAAWVINAYDQTARTARAIHTHSASGLSLSEIMSITEHCIDEYQPERVVVDPSSGGKHLVEEIAVRWGLPAEDAEKTKKAAFLRLGRNALRRGEALVPADSKLRDQLDSVRWDKKYQREAEGQECDQMDAWLYSWRHCMQYYYQEPEVELSEAEQIKQKVMEKVRRREFDLPFDDGEELYEW